MNSESTELSKGRRLFWESTEPLKSREQFLRRYQHIMAVISGGFVVAVLFASCLIAGLFPSFLGFLILLAFDALCLLVAWYLYMRWNARPIFILCPECNRLISSRTTWVCKACGGENRNVEEFPFVHKCGNCSGEPKAYKCHHKTKKVEQSEDEKPCGKMIYLSEDKDSTNYAHCINDPKESPKVDPHIEKMDKLKQDKAEKTEEHAIAEVDEALAKIRDRINKLTTPKRSARDMLRSSVEQEKELVLEGEELKKRVRKEFTGKVRDRLIAKIDSEIMRPRIEEK